MMSSKCWRDMSPSPKPTSAPISISTYLVYRNRLSSLFVRLHLSDLVNRQIPIRKPHPLSVTCPNKTRHPEYAWYLPWMQTFWSDKQLAFKDSNRDIEREKTWHRHQSQRSTHLYLRDTLQVAIQRCPKTSISCKSRQRMCICEIPAKTTRSCLCHSLIPSQFLQCALKAPQPTEGNSKQHRKYKARATPFRLSASFRPSYL